MKIVTLGRGNIGGGLGGLWSRAGHDVTMLGRDGGDASTADVVLVAVPWGSIGEALGKVSGVNGKVTIDATNAIGGRPADFPSLADQVKSIVGGPTAKAFNTNYGVLFDQIAGQRTRPSNLFAADPEAREVTERLAADAGYDPVFVGGLENARMLEDWLMLSMAIAGGGLGPYFYRMGGPGQL